MLDVDMLSDNRSTRCSNRYVWWVTRPDLCFCQILGGDSNWTRGPEGSYWDRVRKNE